MVESKQYTLLRKILKAIGLSDERVEELVALIQSWLTGEKVEPDTKLPYRLRDDFLSPAELNFYRVLQTAVSDWAIVFTKINLGDLFFASTGDFSQNRVYRNKIDRKHVDFLLCDPQTVKPILGIELDDKSHQQKERQERDVFVDAVFVVADLPLARVKVRQGYPTEKLNLYLRKIAGLGEASSIVEERAVLQTAVATAPICPKCGVELIPRTAKSGQNKGNKFWGCPNYPQCRTVVAYGDEA